MAPRIAIIYVSDLQLLVLGALLLTYGCIQYSMYGHIKQMAEAELAGVKSAGGSADLYQ